jgi:hypothetical protein
MADNGDEFFFNHVIDTSWDDNFDDDSELLMGMALSGTCWGPKL